MLSTFWFYPGNLVLAWKIRAKEAERVCLNLLFIYSLRAYSAYGTRKEKSLKGNIIWNLAIILM